MAAPTTVRLSREQSLLRKQLANAVADVDAMTVEHHSPAMTVSTDGGGFDIGANMLMSQPTSPEDHFAAAFGQAAPSKSPVFRNYEPLSPPAASTVNSSPGPATPTLAVPSPVTHLKGPRTALGLYGTDADLPMPSLNQINLSMAQPDYRSPTLSVYDLYGDSALPDDLRSLPRDDPRRSMAVAKLSEDGSTGPNGVGLTFGRAHATSMVASSTPSMHRVSLCLMCIWFYMLCTAKTFGFFYD